MSSDTVLKSWQQPRLPPETGRQRGDLQPCTLVSLSAGHQLDDEAATRVRVNLHRPLQSRVARAARLGVLESAGGSNSRQTAHCRDSGGVGL